MIIWHLVAGILIILCLTTVLNAITFPRLKPRTQTETPKVSILIPARNEAHVIEKTISHLIRQRYQNYEIILLDDQSTDGTASIAQQTGNEKLKIISGNPLPSGWLGKNWACHQLSQAASVESQLLIFTDADVMWHPEALGAIVAHSVDYDMLTVWSTQHTLTWGERLVVPLMALTIIGYLPEVMVRFSSFSAFAAANGQCLIFKRATYDKIGGHTAVKSNITEDIAMAKRSKQQGFKLMMLDGNHLISCRMYQNWSEVRDGFSKNIIAGHGNSIFLLSISTIFHWALFIFPWLWLLIGSSLGTPYPAYPIALIALGLGIRILSAKVTHQRLGDGILMPLSVILMTRITIQAIQWKLSGNLQWKGRVLTDE